MAQLPVSRSFVLVAGLASVMFCGQRASGWQPAQEPVDHATVGPQAAGAEIDISEKLEAVRAKYKLPAIGAALFSADRVLAIGATGVRAMGHEEKVTTDDLWHLGSCTKAMTATLIGAMVEKGELTWETTLEEGLPDLAKEMDPGFKKVTIRQLLTMTGGVPSDLSFDNLWGKLWERKGTCTDQRRQLARGVLTRPPIHEPGSKMLYSNASFAIAGLIAEEKTKTAWETLIAERVFTPLGMSHFGFGAPGEAKEMSQPRGHNADDKPQFSDNPPAIGPAGTTHMPMRDWAKFLMLHVRSGDGPKEIMKPETFTQLHTPVLNGYAMGWATGKRGWGGNILNHNGSNTMWLSVTWLSPEKKFGLLVCTNTAAHDAGRACDEVSQLLIQMHESGAGQPEKK